jgi:hypothetical protein
MSGRRIGEGPRALSPERIDWRNRENVLDAPVAAPEAAEKDFAGAARNARRALLGRGGLRGALAAFVVPRISEPAILSSDHRLVILQDLLPRLDQQEGTYALAAAVVRDEIARQRHLLSLLQQGIAA